MNKTIIKRKDDLIMKASEIKKVACAVTDVIGASLGY
jgi:hypothetical protein